jgi:hypothetical protein
MRLPSSWQLPESIKKRFGQKRAGKQRAMIAEGHLLLVLHEPPQPQQKEREAVFFWRKPNGEWLYSGKGKGLSTLTRHLEKYELAEEKIVILYDKARNADDYFQILEALSPLLRATQNLHSTLQVAREAIADDKDIIDLRDWAYELEHSLDLLYNDTKNALDFHIAKQAEAQTKSAIKSVKAGDRLNTLAAIFLPLTAISSVFGMNLPHGLENSPISLFWIVFLLGISLGIIIKGWVFR